MNANHVIDGWLAQLRLDARPNRPAPADLPGRAVAQAARGSSGPGASDIAAGGAASAAALAA